MTPILIGLAISIGMGAVGALIVGRRRSRPASAPPTTRAAAATATAPADSSERERATAERAYVLELSDRTLLLENAQARGEREEQQDAFGFTDPGERAFVERHGILAAVADGMGGLAFGREAGAAAVEACLTAYRASAPGRSIEAALGRSLDAANRAVLEVAARRDAEDRVGTTFAAIVVHGAAASWIAVGDTRIYLFRRSSNLRRLNADHNYGTEIDRRAGLAPSSAEGTPETGPGRHAHRARLTSYLGLERLPAIERSSDPMPLEYGDRLLVCTDGLLQALPEAEIADILRTSGAGASAALIDAATAKALPAQDNITAVLITCEAP